MKNTNQTIDLSSAFLRKDKVATEPSPAREVFTDTTFRPQGDGLGFRITKIARDGVKASTFTKSAVILGLLALVFYLLPGQQPSEAMPASVLHQEQFVAMATDNGTTGETVLLQSTPVTPGSIVQVTVKRPDGREVELSGRADENGIAHMNLLGTETEISGTYAVRTNTDGFIGRDTTFYMKPGPLSLNNSRFVLDKALARADGRDEGTVMVVVRDQFGNPLSGTEIYVVSSRNMDMISKNSEKTDQNGELRASVRSIQSGTSYITVFESESGQVLGRPLEIKFYNAGETAGDLYNYNNSAMTGLDMSRYTEDDWKQILNLLNGGNRDQLASGYTNNDLQEKSQNIIPSYLMANISSPFAGANTDHFEIDGVPMRVRVGEVINRVGVMAVDSDGVQVDDYAGRVHFRSSDSEAVLPLDAQFTGANSGYRNFDLSLAFMTPGQHSLIVEDNSDNSIFGEITGIVVEGEDALSTIPVIVSPADGMLISSTGVTVWGTAEADVLVSLYDGTEKLGEAISDSDGSWMFHIPSLTEGIHRLTAVATNADDAISPVSETVVLTVELGSKQDVTLVLDPETVESKGRVDVEVEIQKEAGKTEIIVDRRIIELGTNEKEPLLYTGSFVAPREAGDYEIDVIVTDKAGYAETYRKAAMLEVTDSEPELPALAPVTGVRITDQGDSYVELAWRNVLGASRYQVRYGEAEDDLAYFISKNADETTARISGLEAGTTYYLAVVAMDESGNSSEIMPESRVTLETLAKEQYASEDEIAKLPETDDNGIKVIAEDTSKLPLPEVQIVKPNKTTDTGPEGMILLGIFAVLAASLALGRIRQTQI